MTKIALVLGAHKTGTSTVVAMCNADPQANFLYEVDFSQSAAQVRNAELVAAFPNTEHLFSNGHSVRQPLTELLRLNPQFGEHVPRVLGTKIPGLEGKRLRENSDVAIILTVRDIRTWICKNNVIHNLLNDNSTANVVPLAVQYCDFFITSFENENILRLRLEDMTLNNGKYWPEQISQFLGIDFAMIENWHEKRGEIWDKHNWSDWAAFHDSAFLAPATFDTESHLNPHPFWDAYLPIFDKYYKSPATRFARAEVEADRRAVNLLANKFTMNLDEAFLRRKSWQFKGSL